MNSQRRGAWCGVCHEDKAATKDGDPLVYMGRFVCTVCHYELKVATAANPPTNWKYQLQGKVRRENGERREA